VEKAPQRPGVVSKNVAAIIILVMTIAFIVVEGRRKILDGQLFVVTLCASNQKEKPRTKLMVPSRANVGWDGWGIGWGLGCSGSNQ
jgi:hypothetical protein